MKGKRARPQAAPFVVMAKSRKNQNKTHQNQTNRNTPAQKRKHIRVERSARASSEQPKPAEEIASAAPIDEGLSPGTSSAGPARNKRRKPVPRGRRAYPPEAEPRATDAPPRTVEGRTVERRKAA